MSNSSISGPPIKGICRANFTGQFGLAPVWIKDGGSNTSWSEVAIMNLGPLTLLAMASALAQLPASPDPKPVPITVAVVDGSGAPAAHADVWLAEALSPEESRRSGIEAWWSTIRPDEGSTPVSDHAPADAGGRCTFRIPAVAVARRSPLPLAVWAATAGKEARLGWRRLPRIVLPGDPPVPIVLGAPARTDLTILGPEGKPVAGARVTPIRAGGLPIPRRLTYALEATTDAEGRAVIPCLTPEVIGAVRVEAQGFGEQTLEMPDEKGQRSANGTVSLTLAPVGRVAGRLVAPGDEPIRGVTVHATTLDGGYAGSGRRGSAIVACDPRGQFEIPAIAAGTLTLELQFDPAKSPPLRGEAPKQLVAKAGRATEVTIPLRATVNVHGLAREKGTGRPIAGLRILLNGQFGGDSVVVTDARGNYSGRIVRAVNQPFGWPMPIASPYFVPADISETSQDMPPRGSDDLPLPPIELPRGVDVKGSVAGEDGKPVAGAEVEATWIVAEAAVFAVLARTDRSGGFTLHGVDPLAELSLTAWDGFAATPEVTVRAEATATRPIALTISPKNTAHLGGRVVDPAGQPITGASVRIWRQVRHKAVSSGDVDPIAAEDGSVVLRTDADGRYRTRRRFPAHAAYHAEASAPGRFVARSSAAVAARESDPPTVLVLRRSRTVEGRVIDRRGQPVVGAVVRQSGDGPMPTEALTVADGRFQLPGVIEGPALIFAEKPGYQFGFRPVNVGSQPAEVILARTVEPPSIAYHSLPTALPVEEEKALARRLIAPCVENVLARGNEEDKAQIFVEASEIDPLAMLERLESLKANDAEFLDFARERLAPALARENLDEATAMLEAGDTADVRARGYLEICDVRRDLPPARLREFLAQAAVNARGMKSPVDRILVEAGIAERWLNLGETDRARTLLLEAVALGQKATRGIKDGGYNLVSAAAILARIDPPAARKVLEDFERDPRKNGGVDPLERCLGSFAGKVAGHSPADAERVLESIAIKQEADRYIVAACSRMAPKDLARARRIAETRISRDAPEYRAYAFGFMAQEIAATDKSAAIGLIDEAYAVLDRLAAGDRPDYPDVVAVAAALLPIIEQVEPDRLAEFLGRTLALRPSRGDQADRDDVVSARTTGPLAAMVARYDRTLAARLLEPELRKIEGRRVHPGMDESWRVLAALALIDPRHAVEMVQALPDDPAPGSSPDASKNRARIYVARMLALHGTDRWECFYRDFLNLWIPDQRYL
jgi:protocatechuate 3,4-dioxygenase beta subunit